MRLIFQEKPGFSAPGSGWPAANHTESDPVVAEAKLESGWYHEKGNKKKSTEMATKRVSDRHPQPESGDESQRRGGN
ncbi:hypothetical protein LCGC14_0816580 [marine sediment metagenome]|uniref:Uncharacterized protein n=1 Tax=marine sediment metagenome TaxID=412755 RepID=A0A0F9S500_9ZZZZ